MERAHERGCRRLSEGRFRFCFGATGFALQLANLLLQLPLEPFRRCDLDRQRGLDASDCLVRLAGEIVEDVEQESQVEALDRVMTGPTPACSRTRARGETERARLWTRGQSPRRSTPASSRARSRTGRPGIARRPLLLGPSFQLCGEAGRIERRSMLQRHRVEVTAPSDARDACGRSARSRASARASASSGTCDP
jgi:hypothetical protein